MTAQQRRPDLSRRALLQAITRAGAIITVVLPAAAGQAGSAPRPGAPWRPAAAQVALAASPTTGVTGQVVDLASGAAVPGALVTATPGGAQVTADQSGAYTLALPAGIYTLAVTRDGYLGNRRRQTVSAGLGRADLSLIPTALRPDQQTTIYRKLVKQVEAPLVHLPAQASPALRLTDVSLPANIAVYYDQNDGANPPYTVWVPLETYVKGVVPNEVPPTWPAATLQAQAVAARSYGVASFLQYGFVYPDARSQVYDPNNTWPTTDAAVDATTGQVMTVGGAVIFAFFFSQCNGVSTVNSENAICYDCGGVNSLGQDICTTAGWNYVSYCRARSCTFNAGWSGSDCGYDGHGVGMCQWGAYGQGLANYDYATILNAYYTGVTISSNAAPTPTPVPPTPTPTSTPVPALQVYGPYLVQSGQPIVLSWNNLGSGITYEIQLYTAGSPTATWTTAQTWYQVPLTLAVGSYSWSLQAWSPSGPLGTVWSTLVIAENVYHGYIPVVQNEG
jgi:peptidoglycan hydrolase-like amidase